MYLGLAVSLLLHAAVMSWALVSITSAREVNMPIIDPVAVEFISPNDLAKMRQGARQSTLKEAQARRSEKTDQTPKESRRPTPLASASPPPADDPPPPKEEAKAQEQPKPVEQKAAPPPPPPKAEAKAEPDKAALEQKLAELSKEPVGPTPEELKKIEDEKAAEHRRAEEQRKAEEEKKAEEQRKADEQKNAEEERKAEEQKKAEELRKAEEQRKEEERKAEEQRKLEQQRLAEEQKKAEEKRLAEEKRKAELKRLADKKKADEKKRREAEAKAKLDLDRLSALIDKSEPKSAPAAAPQPNEPTKAKGAVTGDREGRDQTISANEAAFLAGLMRQAVSRCWNINAGLEGIEKIVVKVQVRLTRDGRLIGPPRVVNSSPSPLFRDAATSAERALVQCEPYNLPADKYEGGWEFMELNFDPKNMF